MEVPTLLSQWDQLRTLLCYKHFAFQLLPLPYSPYSHWYHRKHLHTSLSQSLLSRDGNLNRMISDTRRQILQSAFGTAASVSKLAWRTASQVGNGVITGPEHVVMLRLLNSLWRGIPMEESTLKDPVSQVFRAIGNTNYKTIELKSYYWRLLSMAER